MSVVTRTWTAGRVREIEGKLMYEAGGGVVLPPPDSNDRPGHSFQPIRRVFGGLRRALGKQVFGRD